MTFQWRSSQTRKDHQGIDNEALEEEDNKAFEPNPQEKERVRQELAEPFENNPRVNEDECHDKGMAKKLMSEPSVSFLGGEPNVHVIEAFVYDLDPPIQQNKDIGVNPKDETILRTTGSLALSNMNDVLVADPD